MGKWEESIKESRVAVDLDPQSAVMSFVLGRCFKFARRYDEAIDQHRATIRLAPDWLHGHHSLAETLDIAGHHDAAVSAFEAWARLAGWEQNDLGLIRTAYDTAGIRGIYELFHTMQSTSSQSPIWHSMKLAGVSARLGKNDETFAHLNRMIDEKNFQAKVLGVDPAYYHLHDDPRFDVLLRKAGLPKIAIPPPPTTP